ncbi:glycosyltransferase family 25 protein [Lophiostoma macrostomum CBS 122681]|uniref:Glycosyltransferase family 25 protein n=1 Tax=Lophiostoma macrostomum CBS 122681 TaxID=1314788 RepID=A0A6A6TMI6_9PLEO|nr:glycosyltransferase family 25 protein [Lophiostoma macrostomum CBS 122681]
MTPFLEVAIVSSTLRKSYTTLPTFECTSSLASPTLTHLKFQKILVLNLPFRTDRRDAITLAAATSNMKLEFVDGVTGDSIKQSAYPPPDENLKLSAGIRGSWRTHMNALQRVVEQNLSTALILEDDVDWDVRVRANLQRYALATRFLSTNHDVLSTTQKYPISYRKNTETPETTFHILSDNGITEKLPSIPLSSIYAHPQRSPQHASHSPTSPYGDPAQWDILWFGHCGAGFPRYTPFSPSKHAVTTANVILTLPNDATVPTGRHLKAHPFQGDLDPLASAYANHTRIYHRATGGELCTVGYAVSQRGARRLLHQFGIKGWNGIFDSELGRWCAGEDEKEKAAAAAAASSAANGKGNEKAKEIKGRERVCLATQPPILAHHHPQNGESDIGGLGGGYARRYETKYLRYSVRMNLEKIVQGAGQRELEDQWPDEESEDER